MKTTAGFTFIELVIALLISSLLSLQLYQSFNQSQRNAQTIASMIDVALVAPIAYNQLDKDISALFVPNRVFKERADQKKQQQKKSELPDIERKPAQEPFKNIFVATVGQQKNLQLISFLTTNSLVLYGTVKPRAARVVYRLVPEQGSDGLFTLTRQESQNLSVPLTEFTENKIRSHDLMRGIKKLTLELMVPEKIEPEKESKKEQASKKPVNYITVDAWNEEEMEKKVGIMIPAFLVMQGAFIDVPTQREYQFEWRFQVMVFDDVVVQLTKKEEKKKETPVPPTPGPQSPPNNKPKPPSNPTPGGLR